MKTISKAAVMLLVALVFSAATRAAGVLEQVPADTWVVVKVNALQPTSDKLAKWSEQIGLAQARPEFSDPIGTLEKELKIERGLDKTGEMAIAIVDPDLEGGDDGDKAMMILLPTSDFKTLTANFKNFKADDANIGSFQDENGKDIFVAKRGGYAAFSPSKELLEKKPAGKFELSAVIGKEMAQKDIVLFANIPVMKEKLLPKLKEAREKALEEVERGDAKFPQARGPKPGVAINAAAKEKKNGGAANADQFKPLGKAMVNVMFDAVEQFMNDSTGVTFSLHLNDEGLNTSLMADFAADSYFGKFASSLKNTDTDLLKGLPAHKYFAFGGISWNSEAISKVLDDVLDPVTKALAGTDSEKEIADAVSNFKQAIVAMKSTSVGYTVPTGALGADSIIQTVQVFHGDAKVIGDAQRKGFDLFGTMLKGMPQDGPAKADIEIKEGAKTVGGIALDSYKFNITMDENDPKAAGAQMGMAYAFGPNGIGGYMGQVDKNTFLIVMGGTDKLLNDAVAGAKANQDVFAKIDPVQTVSKQLPADKIAVEYIDLAQMLTSGVKYAQGLQMPIKLQLPQNLPPIGIAAATDGSALRLDSHVPTSLLQSIVAAGMQTYMQIQGGGGNAGNPDGL